MRVYVAASRLEIERARGVMRRLRAAGCTVPVDWTESVELRAWAKIDESELPDDVARELAKACLAGVMLADVVLLLAPVTVSRFSWGEFVGAIVARDHARHSPVTHVYASGHNARVSICTRLADSLFDTDDAAIEFISRAAARAS